MPGNVVPPEVDVSSVGSGPFAPEAFVPEAARKLGRTELATLAFLASDEAAFVSGSLVLVDGGAHTMRYPDVIARVAEFGG